MFLILTCIPVLSAIYCHSNSNKYGNSGNPASTCEGDACASASFFGEMSIDGCITNVSVTTGCWKESHLSGICYCKTDLCNQDKWSNFRTGQVLAPADCIQKGKEIQCDSTSCLLTTDNSTDTCRQFGDPTILQEMFHNVIMIDQTSKIDSKGNVAPISSLIANCNSLQCTNRAKELESRKFTSSRTQVYCYTNQTGSKQRANETFQYSCTGDFCYVSSYHTNDQTRGCLTIVDESFAERKVEEGKFVFLLLNVFICSTNYCNLEDMDYGNTLHTVESYLALLAEIKRKAEGNCATFNCVLFTIICIIALKCISVIV